MFVSCSFVGRTAVCALAGLALFATAAPARSQTATPPADQPQVITDVVACASMTDNAARLACYDTAVGRLREAQQQGQVVSIDRQRATALAHESFGFTLPNLARLLPSFGGGADRGVNEIQSAVQRMSVRGYDTHVFELANGQTWVQTEPGPINVHTGDTVIIRRGAMGSFLLASPRGGATRRVQRQS